MLRFPGNGAWEGPDAVAWLPLCHCLSINFPLAEVTRGFLPDMASFGLLPSSELMTPCLKSLDILFPKAPGTALAPASSLGSP